MNFFFLEKKMDNQLFQIIRLNIGTHCMSNFNIRFSTYKVKKYVDRILPLLLRFMRAEIREMGLELFDIVTRSYELVTMSVGLVEELERFE